MYKRIKKVKGKEDKEKGIYIYSQKESKKRKERKKRMSGIYVFDEFFSKKVLKNFVVLNKCRIFVVG